MMMELAGGGKAINGANLSSFDIGVIIRTNQEIQWFLSLCIFHQLLPYTSNQFGEMYRYKVLIYDVNRKKSIFFSFLKILLISSE